MGKFFKGVGIGAGISLSVYLVGVALNYKDKMDEERERRLFGTGNQS